MMLQIFPVGCLKDSLLTMAKIKDRNNVPALPVQWTDSTNGHKVWWDTARVPFLGFMQKINDYCDGNGKGRPSEAEVEDQVCAQFPGWACDGPVTQQTYDRMVSHGGCTSCGRRG